MHFDSIPILNLFERHVNNIKKRGRGKYMGNCPFPNHEDKNPSFSFNEKGLYRCFGCNKEGNAVTFAKLMGEDHTPFITFDIDYPKSSIIDFPTSLKVEKEEDVYKVIDADYQLKALEYNNYLINNWGEIEKPTPWTKVVIKETLTGYDKDSGRFVFVHTNESGIAVNIKWHKNSIKRMRQIDGHGSKRIYPMHLLANKYDYKRPLVFCEGEKDCISTLSMNIQAVTSTCGAGSIPEDLSSLDGFDKSYIVYDNDKSGEDGSKKIYDRLSKTYSNMDISIHQWSDEYPEGFDITDYFSQGNSSENFFDMMDASPKIGVFKVITGYEADKIIPKETELIVEYLLPKGFNSILAGSTGCNKSYLAMQLGISIANNEEEFLGFKIKSNNLNVLFVDTEVGEDELLRRHKRIIKNFEWSGQSRFNMISKTATFNDIWVDLKIAIKRFQPDLIIIDCLYNTTIQKDFTKSHYIAQIIDKLTEIKESSGATILCVHHFIKGNHELGLVREKMSGASALQNWAEHIILMAETNQDSLRIIKIDKSRGIDFPRDYFGLEWNPSNHLLINAGIISNWKKLLINSSKIKTWKIHLDNMEENFNTTTWVDSILKAAISERTAKSWLTEMVKSGIIEKVTHGKYKKTDMGFVEDKY